MNLNGFAGAIRGFKKIIEAFITARQIQPFTNSFFGNASAGGFSHDVFALIFVDVHLGISISIGVIA